MAAYRSSPRAKAAEPQLPPEQLFLIREMLASLVRRGSLTFTTTIHTDACGHKWVETQRKRAPLRAAEINSWRRLLFQLAQHGLLSERVEPLPPELDGTVAELRLPWEKQLVANMKAYGETVDVGQETGTGDWKQRTGHTKWTAENSAY